MDNIKKALILLIVITLCLIPYASAENITINNSTNIQDNINNLDDNGTLYLKEGIYKEFEININKNINLEGKNKNVVIDGEGKGCIINVNSPIKLTITNITFINGFNKGNGGAISVNNGGQLILNNCTFINNSVGNSEGETLGGAVYVSGNYVVQVKLQIKSYLTVNNCTFINNHAETDGGAINSYYTQTNIYNSKFINNTATRDGGGVSTRGLDTLSCQNCEFRQNHAVEWGGAIHNWLSEINIANCTIINNSAGTRGGAFSSCGALTVSKSRIINNTANNIAGMLHVHTEDPRIIPTAIFNYNEITGNKAPEASLVNFLKTEPNDSNFDNNYWGNITPNSTEWIAEFNTDNVCSIPTKWLNLVSTTIIASNITRGYNSNYDFKAQFLDKYGLVLTNTQIIFQINNLNYTSMTNNEGIATIANKLNVGTYAVTIFNTVSGEKTIKSTTITKRIQENTDLIKDYLDLKKFSAKIIGDDGKVVGKGEKVSITLNGITSYVTTNNNGKITKKIDLTSGKYIIKLNYKGFETTNKITVKNILKIKNIAVTSKKINVNVLLKYSNGKSLKNKKIQFKINKKIYTAKTNKKGIAKLNIKNKFKKGKYPIYISYVNQQIKKIIKIKKGGI